MHSRVACFALFCAWSVTASAQPAIPVCDTWLACRDTALEAARGGEFERFHDLAWRTVQLGPSKNVELLFLLARAQSLSGRPHDALVMLRRILDLGGIVTPAVTSDDFTRTRSLPDWPLVAAAIDRATTATPSDASDPRPSSEPAVRLPALPRLLPSTPHSIGGLARPTRTSPVTLIPAGPAIVATNVREALRFRSGDRLEGGLAYDAVSGRFLFGASLARKVIVVGERNAQVVDLVRAESASFADIVGLAIDSRRGDLWVASGPGDGRPDSAPPAALHKVQLISGRPLARYEFPADAGSIRIVDLAVVQDADILALDEAGARIWRLRPSVGGMTSIPLTGLRPRSLAVRTDSPRAFVGHDNGLVAVDLVSGRVADVEAESGEDLAGIESMRWLNGRLIGIQHTSDGTRLLSLSVSRRNRVTNLERLDGGFRDDRALALTVAGADIYFAAMRRPEPAPVESNRTAEPETVVWRLAAP